MKMGKIQQKDQEKRKNDKKNRVNINYIYYIIMVDLIVLLYRKTDELLMYLFIIGIVGGAISIIHLYISRNKLNFELLKNDRSVISKNEKVSAKIRVYNGLNILSPYIYIFINESGGIVPSKHTAKCIMVPAKSYKDVEIEYKAKYSGQVNIEIGDIIIQDFFGLFKIRLKQDLRKIYVGILPEIISIKWIEKLILSMKKSMNIESEKILITGTGELGYDLLPYKPGDSTKLIHQKLLARRDICMIRDREELITKQKEYVIVVDPRCEDAMDNEKLIDKMLTATISLIYQMLKQGEVIYILYSEDTKWNHIKVSNKESIYKVADILARYNGRFEDDTRWPKEYLKSSGINNMSKMLITSTLDREYIEELNTKENVVILMINRNSLCEDLNMQTWYLSDEYEVNRYV